MRLQGDIRMANNHYLVAVWAQGGQISNSSYDAMDLCLERFVLSIFVEISNDHIQISDATAQTRVVPAFSARMHRFWA